MITIEITLDFKNNKALYFVEGHANYAPEGYDIVCAAVSSMSNYLAILAEYKGNDKVELDKGNARIEFKDLNNTDFDYFCCLEHYLVSLQHQYPQCLKVERFRQVSE